MRWNGGMTRCIDADYLETFLLPPSVEDWVGLDDPVRFPRDFVNGMDLRAAGFVEASSGSGPGSAHYATSLLLKIWLYMLCETSRADAAPHSYGTKVQLRHTLRSWLTSLRNGDTPPFNRSSRRRGIHQEGTKATDAFRWS